MTEIAPAAVRTSSAKLSMKKSTSRPRKDGPSISKLIVDAVADSKERRGVSLAALKKFLAKNGVDVAKSNKRINSAITKLVADGCLSRTTGTGASGSFKIATPKAKKKSQSAKPVKKATPKKAPAKATRPAAKKSPKRSPAKKPARKSAKKGPAKKAAKRVKRSPKKSIKKRSPKKARGRRLKPAKRPAAKRSPAKRRPAKKAKRRNW